jgi:hypothetical protein
MNVQDIAQDWFESVDRERIPGKGFIGEFELRRFAFLSCDLTEQQDLGIEKTGG